MQYRRFVGFVLALAAILVISLAVSGVNAQETDTTNLVTFGGRVTGIEDEFVALGIGGEDVTVYICDGQPDEGTVTIAEWFSGAISENVVDITSPSGHRVQITVDGNTATGQFTFSDGTIKEFVLELLEGTSGLFRSEFAFGSTQFVAGWLVLPDGSVRGAARNLETGDLTPATLLDFNQIREEDSQD